MKNADALILFQKEFNEKEIFVYPSPYAFLFRISLDGLRHATKQI